MVDLEAYRYKKISQQNIDLQNQMTKVLLAGKSHLNAQKRILKSTIRILNIKSLPKLISLIKNDLKIILGCDEMNCFITCLLYTSPSPRDKRQSRMPSSA